MPKNYSELIFNTGLFVDSPPFRRGRSLGEKAIAESNDSSSTVFNSNGIYITPVICQTPLDIIQTSPDTPRHHPDTPDIGVFAYEKALEENAIADSTDSSSIFSLLMTSILSQTSTRHP